jgi:hypothetical protein
MTNLYLENWSQQQLFNYYNSITNPLAVFIYSPFCGTCKQAENMLNRLLQLDPKITVVKSNILYLPELTVQWRIKSIPCLLIMHLNGEVSTRYRMGNILEMFEFLRSSLREGESNDN